MKKKQTGEYKMKTWARTGTICMAFFSMLFAGTPLLAADDNDDFMVDVPVQVMLGAARYSNLNLDYSSSTDPSATAKTSFEWMPAIGISGAYPITKKPVEIGIEGGAIVSFQNDSVRAVGSNGSIYVNIHNDLVLCDLFIGPSINAEIKDKFRIYGALGPLMMIGWNNIQQDEYLNGSTTSLGWNKSSSVGVGLYARTGVEVRLNKSSWMGIGIRGFKSQLNFDNVSDKTDVQGFQLILTYTARI
jgi:hypothetical protein